ncbi:MAG: hypothetical protein ACPIOQ_58570, partial [Promethearchaeia archaeon]
MGGGPPSFTYLDSELPYGCVTAPEFDAVKGDGWPAFADIAGWAQETDVCEGISEADWNEFIAWVGGSGPPSFTYLDFQKSDGCVTASEFDARKQEDWPHFALIAGYAQETDNCEGISQADYSGFLAKSGDDADEYINELSDGLYVCADLQDFCDIMVMPGTPLSEWCPVTCGVCDKRKSACTRDLLMCYSNIGCEITDNALTKIADQCTSSGCLAHECGICEGRCNSTHMNMCTTQFAQEMSLYDTSGRDRNDLCAIGAQLARCSGECWGDKELEEHADWCLESGCTASECGLPEAYMTCNSSAVCVTNYKMCTGSLQLNDIDHGSNECHDNYEKHRIGTQRLDRPDLCTIPWAGGIVGCNYNLRTDECFESDVINCHCTKEYIDCLRDRSCISETESQEAFEGMCVKDGCSP